MAEPHGRRSHPDHKANRGRNAKNRLLHSLLRRGAAPERWEVHEDRNSPLRVPSYAIHGLCKCPGACATSDHIVVASILNTLSSISANSSREAAVRIVKEVVEERLWIANARAHRPLLS